MLKKKCPRCERKASRKYPFCPFCGLDFSKDPSSEKEDYGFLGKNDFEDDFDSLFNSFSMGKLIRSAMKMTEKMMKEMGPPTQPKQNYPATNMDIQFFVNGQRVFPNNENPKTQEKMPKIKKSMSKEKANSISKLPKKEPKSKMRRIGEKIIYEIEVPGVENVEDVLINQLENSIEIKALSKEQVYSKILNLNLPIIRYGLDNGNLILELQAK